MKNTIPSFKSFVKVILGGVWGISLLLALAIVYGHNMPGFPFSEWQVITIYVVALVPLIFMIAKEVDAEKKNKEGGDNA